MARGQLAGRGCRAIGVGVAAAGADVARRVAHARLAGGAALRVVGAGRAERQGPRFPAHCAVCVSQLSPAGQSTSAWQPSTHCAPTQTTPVPGLPTLQSASFAQPACARPPTASAWSAESGPLKRSRSTLPPIPGTAPVSLDCQNAQSVHVAGIDGQRFVQLGVPELLARELRRVGERIPEAGAGVDDGIEARLRLHPVNPGAHAFHDGRARHALGDLDVDHRRQVPGPERADRRGADRPGRRHPAGPQDS